MKYIKPFAKKFYKSSKWRKCREEYINHRTMLDGGYCEVCREVLGYIVHHKTPLTPENITDENITLNFANLQFDCKACHDREDVHKFISEKPLNCCFDKNGMPIDKRNEK